MGESPRIGDAPIYEGTCIAQMRRIQFLLLGKHIDANLGCGEVLSKTVVQFSGDAASFLILHAKKLHREAAECYGPLLDKRFERIVCPLECLFSGGTLTEVVPNFVLPSPGQ